MRAGVFLMVRAVVSIALMVLFYLMAIAIAGVLLAFAFAAALAGLSTHDGRTTMLVLFAAVVSAIAAGIVLWSILPRIDRFTPPGPEITGSAQPRLFAEIRAVAESTHQRMPAHVYLIAGVQAFVAQRGGIMGIGSRRVMGIGLALLRALQVDELRAVLAHEMGHFHGADTRLGPWIYKTRGALIRTLLNLARARETSEDWGFIFKAIGAPFRWFLLAFLRVSQAISRTQEYSADRLAARTEGTRATVDALQKIDTAVLAHPIYMRSEVMPLLGAGVLPAIGDGFSRFLASRSAAELVEQLGAEERRHARPDPYDSHPPTADRTAAIARLALADRPPDRRPAISLIDESERFEVELFEPAGNRKLKPVSWDATDQVWLAQWRKELRAFEKPFATIALEAIPTDPRAIYPLVAKALGKDLASDDHRMMNAWCHHVASAIALMLVDAGFVLESRVGEPFRLTRGELIVMPFHEVAQLLEGDSSPAAWRTLWSLRGFADRKLVAPA